MADRSDRRGDGREADETASDRDLVGGGHADSLDQSDSSRGGPVRRRPPIAAVLRRLPAPSALRTRVRSAGAAVPGSAHLQRLVSVLVALIEPLGVAVARLRSRLPPMRTLQAGSLLVLVGGSLLQLTQGTYSMTAFEATSALTDLRVWTSPSYLLQLLLGPWLTDRLFPLVGLSQAQPDLPTETVIVWHVRLPRVLTAVFVGACLGISGAVFQAVTRNELASPFVLGVSSGAGLVVLVTLVLVPVLGAFLPLLAAVGGLVAFFAVYAIAYQGGTSPVRLVLAGIVVATIFDSLQRALFFFAGDLSTVQTALSWTTGSLTGVDWGGVRLVVPWAVLTCGVVLLSARQLDVLVLGERTAASLGMSVERVRFGLAIVAVVAAAASVAVAGIVSFVGLIVPHVVRTTVGSDHRRLLVGCLFVGPALVLGADVVARLALAPQQLPVGVVTGLVGGPYFLYLMRKKSAVGEL